MDGAPVRSDTAPCGVISWTQGLSLGSEAGAQTGQRSWLRARDGEDGP